MDDTVCSPSRIRRQKKSDIQLSVPSSNPFLLSRPICRIINICRVFITATRTRADCRYLGDSQPRLFQIYPGQTRRGDCLYLSGPEPCGAKYRHAEVFLLMDKSQRADSVEQACPMHQPGDCRAAVAGLRGWQAGWSKAPCRCWKRR